MFAWVAFVILLLLHVPLAESGKIENSLKYVGRRYSHFDREFEETITAKDFLYKHMTASQVNATKWNNAQNLVNHFVEISSVENKYFKKSFDWVESIISPNMTTEICGDDKTFNSFQYIKYMKQVASQYKKNPDDLKKMFTIMDTDKETLQVNMMFEQTDKNDIKVTMHYDITLKATFVLGYDDSIFSIIHVLQGGSCLEHGIVGYTSMEQEENVIQYLETHPDAKTFLNLFTPKVFQYSEDTKFSDLDVNHLPSTRLLEMTKAEILICEDDPGKIQGTEKFRSWYQRFGQMWHPKAGDDEAITLQGLNLDGNILNARVTMKLQIGTNESAPVHDWNFKIRAELQENKHWSINRVEVLCPATVSNIMDENYLAIRDVVGATFNLYVNDRKQWYTATDFGKHFRKYGETVEFWNCGQQYTDLDNMPKRFWIHDRFWNATMIGYSIMHDMKPLPAEEDTDFTLRIKMRPPKETPYKGDIFGSNWKFYIKWDSNDQFYYFYKIEFSCPQYMRPGDGSFRRLGRHRGIGNYPDKK